MLALHTTSCLNAEILRFPIFFLGWDSFPQGLVDCLMKTAGNMKRTILVLRFVYWTAFLTCERAVVQRPHASDGWLLVGIPVVCLAEMYHSVSPRSGADGSSLFKLPALSERCLCPTGLSALVERSSTSKAQIFLQNAPEGRKSL